MLPDVRGWGSTAAERADAYPCDAHLPDATDAVFRAIDVGAPRPTLFRWLRQLRVAPYSYDWIDNWGRQSPRELVPGLERLAVGQRFMSIFRLVAFEPDVHLTLATARGRLGQYVASYVVRDAAGRSRLVVKLLAWYPADLRPVLQPLGPAADWVMMRKQLLTLKALAERTAMGGDARSERPAS